jgi:periplasmic divalent cation tolerance protein
MSDKGIVVFVTTPSGSDAADIAKTIVSERLAACVNIIVGIRSIFFWEDKVQDEEETLMIIKTRKELFESLKRRILMMHPYSVPEVISLDITDGNEDYLKWLFETVKK